MAAGPRTITRFTRTYEEFDPDGAGGGPSTWVLASPGATAGGAIVGGKSALVSAAIGTSTIVPGMALAMAATGELVFADPNADATAVCVGLALTTGTAGSLVTYTTDNQVSLADWTAVVGTAELTPGIRYFLDATKPGQLSATCPKGAGVYAAPVGTAISKTLLEVEINLPIKQ